MEKKKIMRTAQKKMEMQRKTTWTIVQSAKIQKITKKNNFDVEEKNKSENLEENITNTADEPKNDSTNRKGQKRKSHQVNSPIKEFNLRSRTIRKI